MYYDATASGPDERSQSGAGMMMKTDNGARYQLGQWPSDDPHVYKGGVAVSDNPAGGSDPPWTPGPEYPENGCLSCA